MPSTEKPAQLVSGMGTHHHAVSTTKPEAQKFFDQGLAFVYAFNHDEAIRSFKRAAEIDPELAMAYWGIALALGPNINLDVDPDREKAAYEAVQKALSLAAKAPENERAYIDALRKRYSIDPKADLKQLAVAYSMQGNYRTAIDASDKLVAFAKPMVQQMPMLEPILSKSLLMMVRFNKWGEIMKQPKPDASLPSTLAFWHFARALAFVGRGDVGNAESEQKAFLETAKSVPADSMSSLNPTSKILQIAADVLGAQIAAAKHDKKTALELFRKGVADEDALAYDEPPQWFQPVRESLGGFLLRSHDYAEAEKVLRADLEKNKHSGRSLFGLVESLKAQKKDAATVQREFDRTWRNADTKLTVPGLWP